MTRKKYEVLALTIASTLLLLGTQVNAGEVDDRWYIAPALSYIKADEDRNADNDLSFRLGIGKAISDTWDIEANLVIDSLDFKNGLSKYKQKGLGLDALYFFSRDTNFAPYAVIGTGILNTKTVGESTNVMLNAGLGFKKDLTDNGLALRADARYRTDFDDYSVSSQKRFGDWVFSLGLAIPLGDKVKPAPMTAPVAATIATPAPAAPAKPMDSDGDGVVDSQDRCPNSPAGAKVNAQGCELDSDGDGVVDSQDRCPNSPAGAKVNAQGCELDSDGDGVVDSQDRCPNSPAGAKVNAQGCELDSDGDGVVDSQDRCPTSKMGIKVDNNGCAIPEVIILKGVNFETSSDRLTSDSIGILNGVAETLLRRTEISIEVGGYTDNRGATSSNEKLSQKRAQAVAKYLASRGIKADRLTAKGYGESNPVADNNTETGRAQNRRVELQILEN